MHISRRDLLRAGGLAIFGAAVACKSGGGSGAVSPSASAPAGSFDALLGARQQSMQVISAASELISGHAERVPFALTRSMQEAPFSGGSAKAWIAQSRTSEALGPFDAAFRGDGLEDRGVYSTRITFPADGQWLMLVEATIPSLGDRLGVGQLVIGKQSSMPQPGGDAPSVATPTVDDARGVDPICTSKPICSMHQVSLDDALRGDKPTVVILGTPAFCESRLCGPEVEILADVAKEDPFAGAVDFIHIEQYKDDEPETINARKLAPAAAAWNLEFEPAIYFIEPDGKIKDRFIGPADRADLRDGVRALLS